MDQWLVRTANNILAGPYSRDQVVRLIQEGKLGLQDEVCQGNHYWIFLHEHVEVERQLGIHMPRVQGDDEEITETQTDAANGSRNSPQPPQPAALEIELAPLPEAPADYDGSTAVFSHGSMREAQAAKSAPPPSGSTMSHLAGAGPAHGPQVAQTPTPLRSGVAYPGVAVSGSVRPAAVSTASSPAASTSSDVQIERPSIWKSFAWLMIFVACVLVFLVLRLLHAVQS